MERLRVRCGTRSSGRMWNPSSQPRPHPSKRHKNVLPRFNLINKLVDLLQNEYCSLIVMNSDGSFCNMGFIGFHQNNQFIGIHHRVAEIQPHHQTHRTYREVLLVKSESVANNVNMCKCLKFCWDLQIHPI